jgi:ATP-dependent DNA helicase RecG
MPDKAFVRMLAVEQQRIGRSLPIRALLVLNSLKQLHRASVYDLTEDTNIEETRIKSIIESLTEAGLVEAAGTGKGRYYILSSKVYRNADNTVGYVRQTGIDKLRYSELVLKLAKTQGYVTRGNVAELLHITPPQAYRVLVSLAADNKLKLDGKGKYAKYIPV